MSTVPKGYATLQASASLSRMDSSTHNSGKATSNQPIGDFPAALPSCPNGAIENVGKESIKMEEAGEGLQGKGNINSKSLEQNGDQEMKPLEQLLKDLYVGGPEEEEKDFELPPIKKERRRRNKPSVEPSISLIMKSEKVPDARKATHCPIVAADESERTTVKPLDQLLKDINKSDLEEAEKKMRSYKRFSFDDREMSTNERDRLVQILQRVDRNNHVLASFDSEEESGSKRLMEPSVSNNLWKQILGEKKFKEGMKEVYRDAEESLWPWISTTDRSRIKEIDEELDRLKETHHAQLMELKIGRLPHDQKDKHYLA